MLTRDGGVMTLKSLIDLVNEETYKRIVIETKDEEEKKSIANKVAIACLKYSDSLPYRETDYVFEIDKFADMEGKTGAYILYSTIRMKSLLNKAVGINYKKIHKLFGSVEKEIALTILNLTSIYNKFYSENKVLIEKDSSKKESWLTLTKIVYDINMLLLNTLGIEVPEKM